MKNKRNLALLITSILLVMILFVSCGGDSKKTTTVSADPERTFTYFIPKQDGTGVGGKFDAYEDSPGIKYLLREPFTYKTSVKEGDRYVIGEEITNKVALNFTAATLGQEQNGFITNLSNNIDVLDMNYAPETAQKMYESGKLMDLTYWVENYMPNYLATAEKYGLSDLLATRDENGNKRYLQIYSVYENIYWQYYGYQYRKDWVLEYGKTFNTETGVIGNQTFKEANPAWGWNGDTWYDEIKFPSYYGLQYESDGKEYGVGKLTYNQDLYDYMHGEYTEYSNERASTIEGILSNVQRDFTRYEGQWPATISDWEWMLDIFQVAVNTLFTNRGYPMAIYQAGYVGSGNLISSFGGTGAEWHKMDGNVVLGSDFSAFKTYVSTMADWYENGWIDTNFQANTDLLWRTDERNVRQGYVGLYLGMNDQLFDGMDMGAGNTLGIYTEGMPYPINDKYGSDENKYQIPEVLYAANYETDSVMVSTAAAKNGKDLASLFTVLDKSYTKEMGAIKSWGLTKEQLAISDKESNELYEELGYPDGTTQYDAENDSYSRLILDVVMEDQYLVGPRRIVGIEGSVLGYEQKDRDQYENYIWNYYPDKGYLTKSFFANLNDDQYSLYTDKVGQLRSTMSVDIPKFIKGTKSLDEYDSWYQNLKSQLGLDNITRMLNNKWQSMK